VVIAGPSGVGKGTMIKKLMDEFPGIFGFSVSHTTRDPRPGEVDGIDYNFTNKEAMTAMISAGDFIETANVHGNFYGTSKAAVSKVSTTGKICILDIDVQGVQSVKDAKMEPAPAYIFLMPPNMEALEARLKGRGTEAPEKIAKRLENAAAEIEYAEAKNGSNFDAILVNEDIETCYTELKHVMQPLIDAAIERQKAAEASSSSGSGDWAPRITLAEQIKIKEAQLAYGGARCASQEHLRTFSTCTPEGS